MPEMPLHELHSLSLGSLALRIRRVLLAQSRPEALRNWLLWRLANCHKLCLFFPPDGYWAVFTNWRDMGLYDVDLSAALEEQEKKQATSPQEPLQGQSQVALVKKGKTIKVWSNSFYSMPLRNAFGLIANDPTGGVWIGGFLSEGQWKDPKGFGQFARRAE